MTHFYEEACKETQKDLYQTTKLLVFLPHLIPQNLPNVKTPGNNLNLINPLQLIALVIVIRIVIRLVKQVSAGQQKLSTQMDIVLEHILSLFGSSSFYKLQFSWIPSQ